MSSSVTNSFFWALVIGASFLAAIRIATFAPIYFPTVAQNQPLLDGWRCIAAIFGIVFIMRLLDALPRVRVVTLRNL
jgi:membrane glycosyltransferase